MTKMTLKKQLISVLMIVGLTPFIIMGIISYVLGSSAITDEAYAKLTAVNTIKTKQIEQLFHFRKADLEVLSSGKNVREFLADIEEVEKVVTVDPNSDYPVNNPKIKVVMDKHHGYFEGFMNTYKYYDVFVIDAKDGHVLYTAARESDFGANVMYGSLRSSGLGEVFQMVTTSRRASIVDMTRYAPSNDAPAFFMAAPVLVDGKLEAVVAIQISDKMLNNITQNRAGMGETGETYLVGEDKLMRSDSFLDPTNHSIIASFANPSKGKVDTVGVDEVFAGKTDTKVIMDYNGNPVLSSYGIIDPSKFFNAKFKWAMLSEIDEAEVDIPSDSLRNTALILALVFGALILAGAFYLGNSISRPIIAAVEIISEANSQIVTASDQIALSSTSLADGASQQASSIEEISATVEETTSTNEQNSENAREADILAKDANESAGRGNDQVQTLMSSMKDITASSEQIAKIIKTIDEIAFQTNLLALNAAVEAARAGEHGLGFAVVAEEVKNLAGRSAKAAKETADIIESSIGQVRQGNDIAEKTNDAFADIVVKIKKTSNLIGEIAISAQEQSEGMRQVSQSIGQIDDVTQQNAAVSEEAAAAAEELNAQANSMLDSVIDVANIVGVDVRMESKMDQGAHHLEKRREPTRKIEHNPVRKTSKPKAQTANEEKVFPLDDDDLIEF